MHVGNFDLPDAESLYFKAIVRVNDTSARAYVSECVKGNLQRLRNTYRDRIDVKARELGLTWEQAFNLLAFFDDYSDESIQKAKEMHTTITQDYGQTNLGNEVKV